MFNNLSRVSKIRIDDCKLMARNCIHTIIHIPSCKMLLIKNEAKRKSRTVTLILITYIFQWFRLFITRTVSRWSIIKFSFNESGMLTLLKMDSSAKADGILGDRILRIWCPRIILRSLSLIYEMRFWWISAPLFYGVKISMDSFIIPGYIRLDIVNWRNL